MSEQIRFFWVDAFADKAFGGNPAAVCLANDLTDELQQNLAREFNLSETVFLQHADDGYAIRWFTPEKEVDLVGHATLAAAFVVLDHLDDKQDSTVFSTVTGERLAAYRDDEGFTIELPADETSPCAPPADLIAGLGAAPDAVRVGRHYMAIFSHADKVRDLKPDFGALSRLDRPTIIATAPGPSGDYVLRFFAPANGVPEDPVSGVAQCSLMPYWSRELGRSALDSTQLSARGGRMHCAMKGDRVAISGPCALVAQGALSATIQNP